MKFRIIIKSCRLNSKRKKSEIHTFVIQAPRPSDAVAWAEKQKAVIQSGSVSAKVSSIEKQTYSLSKGGEPIYN